MKKITFLISFILSGSIYSQTVMTFNSSQEITDPISILCQSYELSDIPWDYFCEGIWDDSSHQCPQTSFTAQSSGNYIIRITDVYGNGWNGTTLDVSVNGELILNQLGLDFNNRWVEEYMFYVNEGDLITTSWSNIGPYFNECGYEIASEDAINSVEFPSHTYSQIYYRQFIPQDFGFSGDINLTEIQFGVWYTDSNGINSSSLQDVNAQANIYINNNGGIGGEFGINQDNLNFVASTGDITITHNDHQSIVSAPIQFNTAGVSIPDGLQASSETEYVVEIIFPGGEPSPMSPAFRLSTGGNFSDFTLAISNQSQNPSTIANSMNCIGFFTYTPDNTSLINLVSSDEPTIPTHEVVFNVDMTNETVEPEGVFLGGGVFGGAKAYQMFDDNQDNIYSVSLQLQEGASGNYLFINGPAWGGDFEGAEQLVGQECADTEFFNNRFFEPISGPTTLAFCYGECSTQCTSLGTDYASTYGIKYFPNPINDKINIMSEFIIDKVNVKNIVGQDLIETSPNAKDFELDFSTLPSGGYFLKLTSGNNTKILRIIVE